MSETQKEIPFNVIETELQLKAEDVEGFVIDGKFTIVLKYIVYQILHLYVLIVFYKLSGTNTTVKVKFWMKFFF